MDSCAWEGEEKREGMTERKREKDERENVYVQEEGSDCVRKKWKDDKKG